MAIVTAIRHFNGGYSQELLKTGSSFPACIPVIASFAIEKAAADPSI
jgi:hypothetical protein